ncbi:MAG TPA: hypothetical protein VGC32_04025 [Solirubrobacterales bacterium]
MTSKQKWILVLAAMAAGGYASPTDFSDGFVAAISVSAGLSVAAALFGAALPARQSPLQAEPRTESSVVRSSSA